MSLASISAFRFFCLKILENLISVDQINSILFDRAAGSVAVLDEYFALSINLDCFTNWLRQQAVNALMMDLMPIVFSG